MATKTRETKTTAKTSRAAASKAAAKTAAPKTESVKTAEVKEEAVKEAPKAAAKKAPAKKAVKPVEPVASVYVQYADKELAVKELLEAAKAAYAENHKDVEIKTIELYVKPEEAVAYYVVNGEGSGDYKIAL